MKEFLAWFVGSALFCYLIISVFAIVVGCDEQADSRKYPNIHPQNDCEIVTNMTVYVLPAFKLGCWLGEEYRP